ncbi:hypothetical protein ACQPZQ_06325 [Pseudonocardia sp. CA-142604]|uniref:hypothetical protein n=1 Tax=Pseudonocardia sp. CA-142604 TaxID=3240024 RepID=UPI003D94CC0B
MADALSPGFTEAFPPCAAEAVPALFSTVFVFTAFFGVALPAAAIVDAACSGVAFFATAAAFSTRRFVARGASLEPEAPTCPPEFCSDSEFDFWAGFVSDFDFGAGFESDFDFGAVLGADFDLGAAFGSTFSPPDFFSDFDSAFGADFDFGAAFESDSGVAFAFGAGFALGAGFSLPDSFSDFESTFEADFESDFDLGAGFESGLGSAFAFGADFESTFLVLDFSDADPDFALDDFALDDFEPDCFSGLLSDFPVDFPEPEEPEEPEPLPPADLL